jgi:hypothetical protein
VSYCDDGGVCVDELICVTCTQLATVITFDYMMKYLCDDVYCTVC